MKEEQGKKTIFNGWTRIQLSHSETCAEYPDRYKNMRILVEQDDEMGQLYYKILKKCAKAKNCDVLN